MRSQAVASFRGGKFTLQAARSKSSLSPPLIGSARRVTAQILSWSALEISHGPARALTASLWAAAVTGANAARQIRASRKPHGITDPLSRHRRFTGFQHQMALPSNQQSNRMLNQRLEGSQKLRAKRAIDHPVIA